MSKFITYIIAAFAFAFFLSINAYANSKKFSQVPDNIFDDYISYYVKIENEESRGWRVPEEELKHYSDLWRELWESEILLQSGSQFIASEEQWWCFYGKNR